MIIGIWDDDWPIDVVFTVLGLNSVQLPPTDTQLQETAVVAIVGLGVGNDVNGAGQDPYINAPLYPGSAPVVQVPKVIVTGSEHLVQAQSDFLAMHFRAT